MIGLGKIPGDSLELYQDFNHLGRQANRGMEGLTITPDGRTLVGLMQNALLQDNALTFDASGVPSRQSVNNRILTIDLVTGETHEYIYTLENFNQGRGTNEMLAINNHEFLVSSATTGPSFRRRSFRRRRPRLRASRRFTRST